MHFQFWIAALEEGKVRPRALWRALALSKERPAWQEPTPGLATMDDVVNFHPSTKDRFYGNSFVNKAWMGSKADFRAQFKAEAARVMTAVDIEFFAEGDEAFENDVLSNMPARARRAVRRDLAALKNKELNLADHFAFVVTGVCDPREYPSLFELHKCRFYEEGDRWVDTANRRWAPHKDVDFSPLKPADADCSDEKQARMADAYAVFKGWAHREYAGRDAAPRAEDFPPKNPFTLQQVVEPDTGSWRVGERTAYWFLRLDRWAQLSITPHPRWDEIDDAVQSAFVRAVLGGGAAQSLETGASAFGSDDDDEPAGAAGFAMVANDDPVKNGAVPKDSSGDDGSAGAVLEFLRRHPEVQKHKDLMQSLESQPFQQQSADEALQRAGESVRSLAASTRSEQDPRRQSALAAMHRAATDHYHDMSRKMKPHLKNHSKVEDMLRDLRQDREEFEPLYQRVARRSRLSCAFDFGDMMDKAGAAAQTAKDVRAGADPHEELLREGAERVKTGAKLSDAHLDAARQVASRGMEQGPLGALRGLSCAFGFGDMMDKAGAKLTDAARQVASRAAQQLDTGSHRGAPVPPRSKYEDSFGKELRETRREFVRNGGDRGKLLDWFRAQYGLSDTPYALLDIVVQENALGRVNEMAEVLAREGHEGLQKWVQTYVGEGYPVDVLTEMAQTFNRDPGLAKRAHADDEFLSLARDITRNWDGHVDELRKQALEWQSRLEELGHSSEQTRGIVEVVERLRSGAPVREAAQRLSDLFSQVGRARQALRLLGARTMPEVRRALKTGDSRRPQDSEYEVQSFHFGYDAPAVFPHRPPHRYKARMQDERQEVVPAQAHHIHRDAITAYDDESFRRDTGYGVDSYHHLMERQSVSLRHLLQSAPEGHDAVLSALLHSPVDTLVFDVTDIGDQELRAMVSVARPLLRKVERVCVTCDGAAHLGRKHLAWIDEVAKSEAHGIDLWFVGSEITVQYMPQSRGVFGVTVVAVDSFRAARLPPLLHSLVLRGVRKGRTRFELPRELPRSLRVLGMRGVGRDFETPLGLDRLEVDVEDGSDLRRVLHSTFPNLHALHLYTPGGRGVTLPRGLLRRMAPHLQTLCLDLAEDPGELPPRVHHVTLTEGQGMVTELRGDVAVMRVRAYERLHVDSTREHRLSVLGPIAHLMAITGFYTARDSLEVGAWRFPKMPRMGRSKLRSATPRYMQGVQSQVGMAGRTPQTKSVMGRLRDSLPRRPSMRLGAYYGSPSFYMAGALSNGFSGGSFMPSFGGLMTGAARGEDELAHAGRLYDAHRRMLSASARVKALKERLRSAEEPRAAALREQLAAAEHAVDELHRKVSGFHATEQ